MAFIFPSFLLSGKLPQIHPRKGKFVNQIVLFASIYICIFLLSITCVHVESNKAEQEKMVGTRLGIVLTRRGGARTWFTMQVHLSSLCHRVQHFHVAQRTRVTLIHCYLHDLAGIISPYIGTHQFEASASNLATKAAAPKTCVLSHKQNFLLMIFGFLKLIDNLTCASAQTITEGEFRGKMETQNCIQHRLWRTLQINSEIMLRSGLGDTIGSSDL